VLRILPAAFGGACVILSLLGGAAVADDSLAFTVVRDGDEIGTHEIEMKSNGDRTEVEIETDVAVKLAFITVYNFEHEGHEVWQGGRLVSYESRTDDDGTDKSLRARAAGEGLAVDGSAVKRTAPDSVIPGSLWNRATVTQSKLMNSLDGSEMAITVNDLGDEDVVAGGKTLRARHYALTGDLQREVWYDSAGRLVKVQFSGSDGSDIQYLLK